MVEIIDAKCYVCGKPIKIIPNGKPQRCNNCFIKKLTHPENYYYPEYEEDKANKLET